MSDTLSHRISCEIQAWLAGRGGCKNYNADSERDRRRYDIEFEQIGCDKDHVHILCTAHPKIGPGQIVRVFKSITARELFKRKPDLKRDLWGGEFWTNGYYVATVGERADWDVVEGYVKNQVKPKDELLQLALF